MKTTLIHYPADNRMILVSDEDEFILADNYDTNTPTIDLSLEVSDFLGIVDVEKLAKDYTDGYVLRNHELIEDAVKFGFQKAQELNKKLFTLEDMISFSEWSMRNYKGYTGTKVLFSNKFKNSHEVFTVNEILDIWKDISKSPKEYEVETDTEYIVGDNSTDIEQPKITNNKIKVITIKTK